MVVDPSGEVSAELGATADLLVVEIDPDRALRARTELPVLANRVIDLPRVRRLA
ncbi:hypothetical protein SDC9_169248 [bioreactor metagenome]|uniref:CN hydrolase domain-containing protein n=1 Tax=bioreactor metagenome TaxID=1076179 RepID=A0A645G6T6_9ZZZZ